MLVWWHHQDPFDVTYPDLTQRITLYLNVTISLAHPKEKNTIVQVEQRS
jgi:hypothetical protein